MSALQDTPLRLKDESFCSDVCGGGLSHCDYRPPRLMNHNTSPAISPAISPPGYRFPDISLIQYPTLVSPPSSPSDSPLTPAVMLPSSSDSSNLSLHSSPADSLGFPQPSTSPPLQSIRDFYLPTLTPDEILDTLDHIAANTPKKKSHARKQPAGHIPRPRNAFILFRCLFVSQQAVPASVEKDHRNISRIAGKVWKSMSNEEKDPWVRASELEKARHEAKWPGYRYNPIQTQTLPRRFQGIPRVSDGDYERQVRPAPRIRLKDEDEGDSSYGPRIIPHFARVESMPPPVRQSSHEEQERDGKCAHVANLVREGKQGYELEAAIRGYASPRPADVDSPNSPMRSPEFPRLHPFAVCAPVTPIGMKFPRAVTPSAYEMSFPPESPPPTQTHSRLATRRSSSCPPLPPLGPVAFPFNNPNPWLTPTHGTFTSQASSSSSSSPSPFASTFLSPHPTSQSQSPFESPFAFPPPSPFPGHESEAQDEHRPLTAPQQQHHDPPPRANLDISSRLMHRRGSSLDRAIASSSIAGAFGGGLPKPSLGTGHLMPDAFMRLDPHFAGQATPTEFGSSSGTGTPALTPQSSFEISSDYTLNQRGRPYVSRALHIPSESHDIVVCQDQEHLLPHHEPTIAYSPAAADLLEPCPLHMYSPNPRAKMSVRLFGSQGARLGLDLDLPLAVDISFNPQLPPSASTPYSSQNSTSDISPGSAYPYTPASPPNADGAQPYNFSYTQALMDTDSDIDGNEFHTPS